jgi:hypothetical protein
MCMSPYSVYLVFYNEFPVRRSRETGLHFTGRPLGERKAFFRGLQALTKNKKLSVPEVPKLL